MVDGRTICILYSHLPINIRKFKKYLLKIKKKVFVHVELQNFTKIKTSF